MHELHLFDTMFISRIRCSSDLFEFILYVSEQTYIS